MPSRDSNRKRPRSAKRAAGRPAASARQKSRPQAQPEPESTNSAQAQLLQGVQQVWLAGMGAIARAQQEGPTAFQAAVVDGLKLLNQSRSTAQRVVRGAFENAQETLQKRTGGARGQAQETWVNLETLFQSRVQRAMHQLGLPTADEIRELADRVGELNENVRQMDAQPRARKSKRAKATKANPRARRASKPPAQ